MKHSRQDFSLLKLDIGIYIIAGPASLVNYSYEFNARLSRRGLFIQVIIKENIEIRQEIIIYYNKEYFYPGVEVLKNSEEEEVVVVARLK